MTNDQTESSSEQNTVFTQLKFFNSGFKAHKSQEELLMEAIKENWFYLIVVVVPVETESFILIDNFDGFLLTKSNILKATFGYLQKEFFQ